MDLRNCLSSDHCLFIDRYWEGESWGEVRAPLREMVDLSDKLDRSVLRRSSLVSGSDLHESFNGQ